MPAVETFRVIASQWRTLPLADGRVLFLGLDYAAARAGLAFARRRVDAATWASLQLMEGAAAAALNGR